MWLLSIQVSRGKDQDTVACGDNGGRERNLQHSSDGDDGGNGSDDVVGTSARLLVQSAFETHLGCRFKDSLSLRFNLAHLSVL